MLSRLLLCLLLTIIGFTLASPPKPIEWYVVTSAESKGSSLFTREKSGVAWSFAIPSAAFGFQFTVASIPQGELLVGLREESQFYVHHGFKFVENGFKLVLSGTETKKKFGVYSAKDEFKIVIRSKELLFIQNSEIIHTEQVSVYSRSRPTFIAAYLPAYTKLTNFKTFYENIAFSLSESMLGPGEPVSFQDKPDDIDGVTVAPGSVTAVPKRGEWAHGAFSTETFSPGGPVGGVQFTAPAKGEVMVGLNAADSNIDYKDIMFAIYLKEAFKKTPRTLMIYESGNRVGEYGIWAPGDVFGVQIDAASNRIVYTKNNGPFHTTNSPAPFPLGVDVSIQATGNAVSGISWAPPVYVDSNAAPDQRVNFMPIRGLGINPDNGGLVRVKSGTDWDAGATSAHAITQGEAVAGVKFTVTGPTTELMVGLKSANEPGNDGYGDITYAIYLKPKDKSIPTNLYGIYERGNGGRFFDPYDAGSTFAIQLNQFGQVEFKANDATFYTSTIAPEFPLYVDVSIRIGDVANVIWQSVNYIDHAPSNCKPVTWKNIRGVYASQSKGGRSAVLTKNLNDNQWNAGASSGADTSSGAVAGVQWRPGQTNKEVIIGLSYVDNNQDYGEIAYGILAASNGEFRVYENSQKVNTFGQYAVGDRFEIFISNGAVQYARNGATFYISTLPVSGALIVDTTFFHDNSEAYDILWITGPASCSNEPAQGAPPAPGAPPAGGNLGEIAAAEAIAIQARNPCYSQGARLRLGPDCYDCSGLVFKSWEKAGISLPGSTGAYAAAVNAGRLRQVSVNEIQAGDILFKPGHVGIYVGNGEVVSAMSERLRVIRRPLSAYSYYDRVYRPVY